MDEKTGQKRSPPVKYLVLSVKQLKILTKMAHATGTDPSNPQDYDVVVLNLEHSGPEHPGQLRYTDFFRHATYQYWPDEEGE